MSQPAALELDARLGPETRALIDAVLAAWPAHAKFLRTSFADRSAALLDTTELIAALLSKVTSRYARPLSAYAEDYRYLCEKIVFPEEMFFAREDRYRLSTFEEAAREVYDNAPLMAKYMNGLFVSDALWLNHASAMNDFAKVFLPATRPGGAHLEIGPGHGMLLHLALRFGAFASHTAWDVSPTSITHAREVLASLGEADRVDLRLMDLYAADAVDNYRGRFDTVVLSEVLEHLEKPVEALERIRDLLSPGGSVWINVPANGPAPDHLFLLRSVQDVVDLVNGVGLSVVRSDGFPVAGATLERALRRKLPISCVVVATKAT